MSNPDNVRAAGVICRSPHGRILMVRRTDDGTWAFPGGGIKDGEDAAQCAWREFFEETGYRLRRWQAADAAGSRMASISPPS
jgi:8-oxo-dGTP diphosphatase